MFLLLQATTKIYVTRLVLIEEKSTNISIRRPCGTLLRISTGPHSTQNWIYYLIKVILKQK